MLAIAAPDPVMSVIAPVGLAASVGTALIIDHIGASEARSTRTLADTAAEGPRLDEISPGRPGVARIIAGPLDAAETLAAAESLATRWPAVVVRAADSDWPGPLVPIHVLYGPAPQTWKEGAAVWQSLATGHKPPGPGPVLPPLKPAAVRQILRGWMPRPGRWIRAWRPVWEMPWA